MRSGQPGINSYEYGNLLVPTPSTDEQTPIVTILYDMDSDIQTLLQRMTITSQIKQGIMQRLLTGKMRLVKPKPSLSANDMKEYAHEQ